MCLHDNDDDDDEDTGWSRCDVNCECHVHVHEMCIISIGLTCFALMRREVARHRGERMSKRDNHGDIEYHIVISIPTLTNVAHRLLPWIITDFETSLLMKKKLLLLLFWYHAAKQNENYVCWCGYMMPKNQQTQQLKQIYTHIRYICKLMFSSDEKRNKIKQNDGMLWGRKRQGRMHNVLQI